MSLMDQSFWLALVRSLVFEAGCIILLASLANRVVQSAFWRRSFWQAVVICLLLLGASELSGFGRGVAAFAVRDRTWKVEKMAPDSRTISPVPLRADRSVITRPDPAQTPLTIWWPAWLWLGGFAVVMFRVVLAQILSMILCRRWPNLVNAGFSERVELLLNRLGCRRKVLLLQASGLASPFAFGIFRPAIALPPEFVDAYAPATQEAVLAHELAHLAARDPLWYLLADAASALLWWNPFVWWARRQLHRHCELAADQATVIVPNGPVCLAECLVRLGAKMSTQGRWGLIGVNGSGFGSNLGERVKSLVKLGDSESRPPRGWRIGVLKAGGTMLLAAMAICLCGWIQDQDAPGDRDFRESWQHSAASAFLLAALDSHQTEMVSRLSTNLVSTSAGRRRILSKLERIRINQMGPFRGLPLTDVVNKLREASQKGDPDGVGLNFMFTQPGEPVDFSLYSVTLDPALTGHSLAEVLDAITKVVMATDPSVAPYCIRYTVEDYAVVFSAGASDQNEPALYTKVFKVDPEIFVQSLEKVENMETNKTGSLDGMLRNYFTTAGVNLRTPKFVSFNQRMGGVLARAYLPDLDIIQQAVEVLSPAPPQLTIESKFVEMDNASAKEIGLDWVLTGKEDTKILSDAESRRIMDAVKQRGGATILAAPKVTTLSGRRAIVSSTDGEMGVTLDVLATIGPDGYAIQTTAAHSSRGKENWFGTASLELIDGQTLASRAASTGQPGDQNKVRLVFVTPRIIDAAGNRVHSDEQISRHSGLPVQPPK